MGKRLLPNQHFSKAFKEGSCDLLQPAVYKQKIVTNPRSGANHLQIQHAPTYIVLAVTKEYAK